MKTLLKILLTVLLLCSFSQVAHSQKSLYDNLNKKLAILFKKSQYSDAVKVAKEVLKVAEETFGKKHPYVSASLNNLALLYMAQGEYEKAESTYEQSLEIAEEILSKNNPQLINIMQNLIKCCEELGKYDKVYMLEDKIEDIEDAN